MAILAAGCLWGAAAGWAAALALLAAGSPPSGALVAYGAAALFGAGYLAGTSARGRVPSRLVLHAAGGSAVIACAAKLLVPTLEPWTAPLIAAAVAGVITGWRSG
jgi:hypothetical protein